MHYFCGGAGSLQLQITTLDKTGHRILYASQSASVSRTAKLLPPETGKRSATLAIHKEAFAEPFDRDKISLYMNSLPRDGEYFVVEGDLLLTEQELRSYLVASAQTEKPAVVSPELLVSIHNGEPDFYRDPSKRNLTYAVERKTFSSQEYKSVVQNMDQAGKAWESACSDCQIRFTHVAEFDDNPQSDKLNFIVRKHDSKGEYIAASFFPHDDPLRRNLNIDPSYFSTRFDKIGVLRHEMGHILGYRHEHIRGIQGCYYEDNAWQPLTVYDPKSVMHYFCGGAGSLQLQITTLDKTGHRTLYGHTNASLEIPGGEATQAVVINFEGGYISENIIRSLNILRASELISVDNYEVKPGDSLETIFFTNPEFPYDTKVARDLARYLNGTDVGFESIRPGQRITVLRPKLEPYDFSMFFDLRSEKGLANFQEIKNSWSRAIKYEVLRGDTNYVTLRGYQLRISVKTEQEAKVLQNKLLLELSTYTTTETAPESSLSKRFVIPAS